MTRRRLVVLGPLAGAVLLAGWLILSASGENERFRVLGTALDPEAVADACREVEHGEVGYALRADAPPDPTMVNVYATVGSRGRAVRVADCFRKHGAHNVQVSEAGPEGSFSPN